MTLPVTVVIPTHNRHNYLSRVLEYYKDANFEIVVADSTIDPYIKKIPSRNIYYLHLPGKTLTQKLFTAFNLVNTPYLVICADDDFIIPEAIHACVDLLSNNLSYAAASGNNICYRKADAVSGRIQFAMLNDTTSEVYNVNDRLPFERLNSFFNSYREIFYAVHRTKNLQFAFQGAEDLVKNLYLNEYLTVIVPIISGGFIKLPILYQVREYVEAGGDKMADNLDTMFHDQAYQDEYTAFLNLQSAKISVIINESVDFCKQELNKILTGFAHEIHVRRATSPRISFDKKIGRILQTVPYAGTRLIQWYRRYRTEKQLKPFIRGKKNDKALAQIKRLILKFGNRS